MKFVMASFMLMVLLGNVQAEGPYQATGIKICEVDQNSAIIWTRLTRISERLGKDHPKPIVRYKDPETGELKPRKGRPNRLPVVRFPDGSDVHTIEGAVPGIAGDVRVRYAVQGKKDWQETNWQAVDSDRDFIRQIKLVNLQPGTAYQVEVESRTGEMGQMLTGRFRTAPSVDRSERIVFHVTTGQAYGDQD
ncbi:MAG: hypothetical protein HOE48_11185, partial [Candidatus Latescibacteria bacterium]|nr:hypothetical protein [Candidatus Latescibacterota bacterium]